MTSSTTRSETCATTSIASIATRRWPPGRCTKADAGPASSTWSSIRRPRSFATISCDCGILDGTRRPDHFGHQRLLGLSEVCEALGTSEDSPNSQLPTPNQCRRERATLLGVGRLERWELTMFSLHIDTARGWRGGQSQVLHIVQGLRAIGHRAALVAHPDGELLRRMSEGHDLIPLATRGEVDLVGGVAAVAADQAAGARGHSRARSACGRDGGDRPVDCRAVAEASAHRRRGASSRRWRRTRSRAGSIRRSIASSPTAWRSAIGWWPKAFHARRSPSCTRGRRRAHRPDAGGERTRRVLPADARADRRQRRRPGSPQGPSPPDRRGRAGGPRRARRQVRDRRRRRTARRAGTPDPRQTPRAARVPRRVPDRRARADQGLRPLCRQLGHGRACARR